MMDQKIKKTMQEKIKSNKVFIGLNSTVRAAGTGKLDFVVYASNISEDMLDEISKLGTERFEYDGDSEALSIACGKSFNVTVLGMQK